MTSGDASGSRINSVTLTVHSMASRLCLELQEISPLCAVPNSIRANGLNLKAGRPRNRPYGMGSDDQCVPARPGITRRRAMRTSMASSKPVLAGDFGDPVGEFAEGRSGGKAKRNRRIREDHAQPRFACLPIMMRLHVALHCSAVVDETDGKRGVPARTGSETTLGRAQSTDRPSDVERRISHFNSNLARLR